MVRNNPAISWNVPRPALYLIERIIIIIVSNITLIIVIIISVLVIIVVGIYYILLHLFFIPSPFTQLNQA